MARYQRRHKRPHPRPWWGMFLAFGGWAAIGLGALVVFLTLSAAGSLYLADLFDREGRIAHAVIADKRETVRIEGEDREETDYHVTFVFKARGVDGPAGRTVETRVDAAYYAAAEIDEERAIRYLVTNPDRIETEIGKYRADGRALRTVGLVLGIVGLAALWFLGNRANRAVKVRRDGEKRFARVTALRDARWRLRGTRQARLQWREEDGAVGESLPHNARWLREQYRPGDLVVVYRLGRHVFWEGDVGPPRRETGRGPAARHGAGAPPGA